MPETIPTSEAHYLMPAYHALELALESELRAQKFFEQAERSTRDARVRDAAREMAAEEREHVRLIKDWMKRVPKPEPGWDYDPDPPTYSE
jgi:rubrerythrin